MFSIQHLAPYFWQRCLLSFKQHANVHLVLGNRQNYMESLLHQTHYVCISLFIHFSTDFYILPWLLTVYTLKYIWKVGVREASLVYATQGFSHIKTDGECSEVMQKKKHKIMQLCLQWGESYFVWFWFFLMLSFCLCSFCISVTFYILQPLSLFHWLFEHLQMWTS